MRWITNVINSTSNTSTRKKQSYSGKKDLTRVRKVNLSSLSDEDANFISDLLNILTFLKNHLFLEIGDFLVIPPSNNLNKKRSRLEILNQFGNLYSERREQHEDLESFLTNDYFLPKYPDRQGILDLLGLAYSNNKQRKKILLDLNTYIREGNSFKFLIKLILWSIQPLLPQVEFEGVKYDVFQLNDDNFILLEQEAEINVYSLLSKDDQEDLNTLNNYFKRLGYDYLCNLEGWDQSRTQLHDYQFSSKLNNDSDYICRGLWLILVSNPPLFNSLSIKLNKEIIPKEIRKFNSYINKEKDSLIDWRVDWQGRQEENVLQKHNRIITNLDEQPNSRIRTFKVKKGNIKYEIEREKFYADYWNYREEEHRKMQQEEEQRVVNSLRARTSMNRFWLFILVFILVLGSLFIYMFFNWVIKRFFI